VAVVDVASQERRLRVLDLACGPGSLTYRLLAVRPDADVVAVDLDPVLLTIYASLFPTAKVVEADLRDPDWSRTVGADFDAVVTATALHWMDGTAVERLYRDLAGLLRPGGLFLNADHVPLDACPGLSASCAEVLERERRALDGGRRRQESQPSGTQPWEGWWRDIANHPVLGTMLAERDRRFSDRGEEFAPPAEWHLEALRRGGFVEQSVVWRRGRDAIIAASR
jgi:SAM-dependent methyltransferase